MSITFYSVIDSVWADILGRVPLFFFITLFLLFYFVEPACQTIQIPYLSYSFFANKVTIYAHTHAIRLMFTIIFKIMSLCSYWTYVKQEKIAKLSHKQLYELKNIENSPGFIKSRFREIGTDTFYHSLKILLYVLNKMMQLIQILNFLSK